MKTNVKIIFINIMLTALQIGVIIPVLLLEYFSTRKMGVMRYLVYINRKYEATILNSLQIIIYKYILIISIIFCSILLTYNILKNRYKLFTQSLIFNLILNLCGIVIIFSKLINTLNAYFFFLISIFVIVILQYIKCILVFVNNSELKEH